MSEKDKTILIVILAIAALCGCLLMSCCAVGFYTLSRMDRKSVSSLLSDTEPVSVAQNPQTETIEIESAGGLSSDEQKIIDATEEIRGLSAEEKFAPIYQTEDELREYFMGQLSDVTDEEFEDELALYRILGFVPQEFDLRQFYVDLYSEQTAGFYDPETNEMYLIGEASPYDNALTLAHEYTHYLQYNNPLFSDTLKYDDDFCEENNETCLVIDALVEGDASLTENLIDPESLLGHKQTSLSSSSGSVYDSAPKFFQDTLLFPYVYGFDFVAYHYLKGGFDAVNDLYINRPQSIEQIMHPEKYLKDTPVDVTLEPFRSIIGDDFEIKQESVLNESDIMMLLGSSYNEAWRLSERQSVTGAAGWGGGSYLYAEKDGKGLFFTKTVWDSASEAQEAEITFELYCDKRFGEQTGDQAWSSEDSASVYLIRQDDILYWMILPDNFESEDFIGLLQNGSAL